MRITPISEPTADEQLRELLPRLTTKLRAGLVAYLGPERGEEAFAEAMLYASSHPEKVVGVDAPVAYLFSVGRSRTRVRARRLVHPLTPAAHDRLPEVEPQLHTALMSLTTRQRTALVLTVGWGWTYAEVAELLCISKGAVQTHAERGLARLQRLIGTNDDD